MLTPIERVAACLEVAQRHEHNEPYFKELVAEARTWSQIARNAERQIQRVISNDNTDQFEARLDAVRSAMGREEILRKVNAPGRVTEVAR